MADRLRIGKPATYTPPAAPVMKVKTRGEGLRLRFKRIAGETPKGVLPSALWLPAVLNDFEVREEASHTEYDTVGDGQFSQGAAGGLKARQLRSLDVEALTIEWDAPWLITSGQDPEYVQDALEDVLRCKKAVNMLATLQTAHGAPQVEFRGDVTLRSLGRALRHSERDTRYYSLSLKEHRSAKIGRRGEVESRKKGVKLPATKKLDANDTLHSLSKEFYGVYLYWTAIRDQNKITKKWGASTPLVQMARYKVGDTVKIPKIVAEKVKGSQKSGGGRG